MTGEVKHRSVRSSQPQIRGSAAQTSATLRLDHPAARDLHVVVTEASPSARPRRFAALHAEAANVELPWGKRAFDIVGALALGVLFSPLILLVNLYYSAIGELAGMGGRFAA